MKQTNKVKNEMIVFRTLKGTKNRIEKKFGKRSTGRVCRALIDKALEQ